MSAICRCGSSMIEPDGPGGGFLCQTCEIRNLKDENLRLYRELGKMTTVSPEMQRLQKLLDGVAMPGTCILKAAADEIDRLRERLGSKL